MLLKTSFLLPHLLCNVEFEFSWFLNTKQSSKTLILKIDVLLELKKKMNIEITGFRLMHLGFALVSSDIDLGNIDLLDTYLDLLDTNLPSKPCVSLQNIKTCLREWNYHTAKLFSESLVATEMKKTEAVINKSVYLGLSTLDISKIVIYEFWYDHVKLK